MRIRPPRMRDQHGKNNNMNLPEGKTCGQCVLFKKCQAFIGQQEHDEKCDWSPSYFREIDVLISS